MKRKVYISAIGSEIIEEDTPIPVSRENRKLMRFARTSGKLFINSLYEAMKMADNDSPELNDNYRRGVFFGDFLNLATDKEHRDELFEHCKNSSECFDEKEFLYYIINNWSAVEVLKEVPNIPCFLAAQLTESNGPSATFLNSCASGLSAVKAGYELIQSGQIDIAYVGAGSAKADELEKKVFNSMGYFIDGDYKILNAGAALILESEERLRSRCGNALAEIISAEENFAPDMFMYKRFDDLSFEKLMYAMDIPDNKKIAYILGSFSKKYVSEEREAIKKILPDVSVLSGIKETAGYSFSASGILEVTEYLRKGELRSGLVVSSLGYGGYQSALYISPVS